MGSVSIHRPCRTAHPAMAFGARIGTAPSRILVWARHVPIGANPVDGVLLDVYTLASRQGGLEVTRRVRALPVSCR